MRFALICLLICRGVRVLRVILIMLPFCIFIVLHFLLASHLYVSSDVSYLLNVTEQLLRGEQYGIQIFETNPPLILYLNIPAVIIAQMTGVSVLTVMTGYILILTLVSLFISIILLAKIIRRQDKLIFYVMLNALYFIDFIYTMMEWGQREYLLMIFSLPYILLTVLYLENQPVSCYLSVLIGFFAALGFGLKPFFLLPLMLIECYVIWVKRNILGWVRPASLVLLLTLILYFIAIIIFSPTYFTLMLPLIKHFYFIGFTQPFVFMLQTKTMLYVLLAIIAYFIFQLIDPYPHFSTLLFLFIVGMYVAVLMTGTAWFYHTMPAVSYAFVLLCYFASVIFLRYVSAKWVTWLAFFVLLILLAYPLLQSVADRYAVFNQRQNATTQVLHYLQQLPPSERQRIACLSINTNGDCFPLVQLIGAQYVHGFPFIWWLFGALRYEGVSQSAQLPRNLEQEKHFLINKMADELDSYQPQLIIINVYATTTFLSPTFNLIHFLSKNSYFKQAVSHYRYQTTITRHGRVVYVIDKRMR